MRRLVLWSAAAASLASLLVVGLVCQGPPFPRVGSDWTPERLAREMGEGWESRSLQGGRLLLKRPAERLSWEDLEVLSNESPRRFSGSPGRLLVTSTSAAMPVAHPEPDVLHLRHLHVRGHPDELARVAAAVAP